MARRRESKQSDLVDGIKFILVLIVFLAFSYWQTQELKYLLYIGGVFLVLIIAFFVYRGIRRRFYASKKTLEELRSLTPKQFEEFIGDLFRRRGYATEVVGMSHDGGIDVIANKDGKKNYIQCKKFITKTVRVGDVRDFYGSIVDRLEGGKGFFITTNKFTKESKEFCKDKPIELIDGHQLVKYIQLIQKDKK
ncbi:MAG: restriction endonuclease [Patescibacteria group bacterium]|jgi:restriction system protein